MKTNLLLQTVGMSVVLLLTGCVSASNVGSFSKAASQAATDISNGFNQVQDTTVTRKISGVASDTAAIPDDIFSGLLSDPELTPRLDCLNATKNYADSLGALANADYRTDIDAASKDLYGSLNGLTRTYQKATGQSLGISADDVAIISTAVDAIGNAIVEYKRQKALCTIILKTDRPVQDVCSDLAKTFDSRHTHDFVRANLESVVADMKNNYNLHTATWSYDVRFAYLIRIEHAQIVLAGSDKFITSAANSVKALAKAHKALADSATHGKLSSAEIALAIGELSKEANTAKQFYDQIHQTK